MKRASFLLFALIAILGTSAIAEQYQNIKPEWRCHYKRNNRTFCQKFPNFSLRHGICDPILMGHIEWCREDVTITERDDCGNFETFDAVTITYREVFENGAWGKKFQRTYRKEPSLITPPLLAKGSYK